MTTRPRPGMDIEYKWMLDAQRKCRLHYLPWQLPNDGTLYPLCRASTQGQDNGNLIGYDEYLGGRGMSGYQMFSQVGAISYDKLNRLTGIADSGGWSRTFAYDQWGNMAVSSYAGSTLDVNTPAGNPALLYDVNNRRTDAGQGYDAAGNVNAMAGFSNLTYDAENRLQSVSHPAPFAYGYDGQGRRVTRSGAGNTTVYVYDAAGQLAMEQNSQATAPACTTCYLSYDHLGSIRLITNSGGQVVSRHDFIPFGEEVAQGIAGRSAALGFGAVDEVNQKFTGKERDSESGLDYFGARYYGSALGRFTSPDDAADTTLSVPVPHADLGDPQSLNLYAYVRNNPLRYSDPDGHDYHVCVGNGSGGQNCVTLTDDQYQVLFNQQNGNQGISLPGGPSGGSITCGGTTCGSVSYSENSLYDPLPGIVVGAMGGQVAGLAFKGVGGLIAGAAGRTAGVAVSETAGQGAAKVLLSSGGKQAAKEIIEGLAEGAQKASAKRAVAAATSKEAISISEAADGTLSISRTRPGFDGSQTFTKTIDSAGNSSTVQTAHDAAGNLVHYDPKN